MDVLYRNPALLYSRTMLSTFLAVLSAALLASAQTSAPWGQCGGINYTGPTVCSEGFECLYFNPCEQSACNSDKLSHPPLVLDFYLCRPIASTTSTLEPTTTSTPTSTPSSD